METAESTRPADKWRGRGPSVTPSQQPRIWLFVIVLLFAVLAAVRFSNVPQFTNGHFQLFEQKSAINEFTKAIKLAPSNPQAYGHLVKAYSLKGDLSSIEKVWQEATTNNPNAPWAYVQRARFHQSNLNEAEEIRTWQLAIQSNPNKVWPYTNLIKIFQESKNDVAVVSVYQQMIQANPDDPWAYKRLADHYGSSQNWVLANQTYYRAVNQMPENAEAHQLLGKYLFERGDWQGAANTYSEALKFESELPQSHLYLGRSLLRIGQITRALDHFEQAIALNPSSTYYEILEREYRPLKLEERIASYERITVSTSQDSAAYDYLVNSFLEAGRCDNATKAAQKRVTAHPNESSYQQLANTLLACDDFSAAVVLYEDAIRLFPNSSALHVALGKLHLEQGNLRDATKLFTQVLKQQETPEMYRQINQWYILNLSEPNAMAAMQSILAINKPAIIEPYRDLIHKYNIVGQPKEALSVLSLAQQSNPDNIWATLQLARTHADSERIESALDIYNEAIAAFPENTSFHYDKAELLYRQGDIAKALQSYQTAYELNPESNGVRTRLGRALFSAGQLEEGARLLESTYSALPDGSIYNFMRQSYVETSDWPTSQPYQERAALLRWPGNPALAYLSLANWYAATELSNAADYTYQKALAADPENLATLEHLTRFYLSQSDCKSANQYGLKAAKISPGSATYLQLADVYALCGPPEAMQIAQQRSVEGYVVEQTPQSQKKNVVDRAIHRYRDVLFEDQVITYLADALATLELDRVEPYMQLGWYYEAVVDPPDPQQAVAQYQRAMQVHPGSFDAAVALGRVLHGSGAPEEAIPHYRKAILLKQNDQGVRVRYGRALVESGQVEQGQAVLASALKLEQSDWYTDYAIEGYFSSQPASEALGYITETLTLVPPVSEDVYMSPVRYYLDLGESAAAVKILELAIANNPDLDWAHVKLSYIYRGLKENELAIEQMQRAIQKQPRTAWNHHDLGLLYRANGNLDEALLSLAQAVVLDLKNAWAHIYYGQVLLESGQFERGKSELVVALKAEQTNDVYAFVDTLLKKHLTVEDARNIYALLLEDDPQNQLAQRYLGLWAAE